MLDATTRGGAAVRLRVGIAVDYFEGIVLDMLADFRAANPGLRMQITAAHSASVLRDLRRGTYDVLIGVNLLREGLDLPEVSLVAILDADKEGFLRSAGSLIQTMGRAARHLNGRAILRCVARIPRRAFAEGIAQPQAR